MTTYNDDDFAELIDFRFPHAHKFKTVTEDITACDCGVCMNSKTGKLWRMKSIYDEDEKSDKHWAGKHTNG